MAKAVTSLNEFCSVAGKVLTHHLNNTGNRREETLDDDDPGVRCWVLEFVSLDDVLGVLHDEIVPSAFSWLGIRRSISPRTAAVVCCVFAGLAYASKRMSGSEQWIEEVKDEIIEIVKDEGFDSLPYPAMMGRLLSSVCG